MNLRAVSSIYRFEMARMRRTLVQSIVAPVLSTSLYFVIFGAAIGSRITEIDGVSYGSFIVPGLIMLAILTESISNSSFGIYFPKFTGTIFEILSAPVSFVEVLLGFVGAAATKSVIIGAIILITASFFVDIHIAHPVVMARFHTGDLGRRLGEAHDRADTRHHAADVSRRHVLLDQHAAAGVADDQPVQPRRLSRERIPLELLRERGRPRGA
jgi:hypothetical protein